MAAKRIPNRVSVYICRVCNDRKGTIQCPVCHAFHCDSENCTKDDPSCKTCNDCYHPNCKPCGTWLDPRSRLAHQISSINAEFDLVQRNFDKRMAELREKKKLLVYRLESHERRLGKLK